MNIIKIVRNTTERAQYHLGSPRMVVFFGPGPSSLTVMLWMKVTVVAPPFTVMMIVRSPGSSSLKVPSNTAPIVQLMVPTFGYMVELTFPERTTTRSGPEPLSDLIRHLTLNGRPWTGDVPSVPMFSTVNDPKAAPEVGPIMTKRTSK